MSLLFHQSVNMEQVISIGNYKKVGREPYFFNPQTNNLEGQFFLSAAPYRRLLQNVRCRLRRRCLYGEALGLQKPKPDCYYHQDSIAYNTLLHRHRRCQHLQLKALRLFLHIPYHHHVYMGTYCYLGCKQRSLLPLVRSYQQESSRNQPRREVQSYRQRME